MPLYRYSALNERGRTIRGRISAANLLDLEERLKVLSLDLIDYKKVKESKRSFFGRISLQDLIVFCVHLEQLEKAGVPILDAISDLRDSSDSLNFKNLMAEIVESIKAGDMLSAALAKHPKIFNRIFVALVAAGEKTGNLHEIFFHLSHHLKWLSYIRSKIKRAIYYPLFLLSLMIGIIALMMLFVIPKLSTFLLAQNFQLPFYTKALIATSNFFVGYWYIVFLLPVVIFVLLKVCVRFFSSIGYYVDGIKLAIPYMGYTIRKIEMARFCRFFAIMYRSGIGILDCLDVACNVVKNAVLRENIALVRKSVSEGNSITTSLYYSNQFPSLVIRMFKVGEESGNLDMTLENVNFFYDREVEDSVNNMVGVIQPALTIVMGAIMMWVSLSVFGPLYNSFSKMNF